MSISVKQLKKILGSFSTAVAKDVSGIKTEYATKKDVEGFAKLSDLNNTYIRKGDIHTEDYVTNVIFRDAYQNRLVKKTDLPALDTIATKQEISNAVAAIQVPSIKGLAKESEVEAKLADYAKTTEVAATYATKEAVNAINGLDADTIATLKNLSEHSDLTAIANKVDNVYTKAETNDKLATKADVTAIPSIEGLAKTTDIEITYAKKSELPDVSGLATKQEVTEAVASVQVPSIEGLAKVTDVDAKLATKADVSAIPNISNLATKEEVATVDNKLATKADASAIPSIEGLAKTTEVETKLSDYAKKTELPSIEGLAKTTEVDTKLAAKADVSAIPDVSGLATKAEFATVDAKFATKADVSAIPSIEGLAKTTDIEAAYAKKTELPDVSGLATKAEVEALKTGFVTEETLTQNINQFSTNVDGKINEAKGELEAKVTAVDTKLTDYAKKSELPSVEGLAKATEIESTYAKKTELPDVSTLATKAEVAAITVPSIEGLAKATDVEATYAKKAELPSIEGLAKTTEVDTKLADYAKKIELPDVSGLAKTTEVVAKSVYDEKVQSLESEISTLKAKLAAVASGTTEQRPTENLVVGQQYFDTTLGVPVYWNGTEWHNPFANITTVEVENH